GVEARGHFLQFGDDVGNPSVADLAFGADEPLRHGFFGNEESSGDFVGFQATESPKRESDLRIEAQRRMAAGENQTKAFVWNFIADQVGLVSAGGSFTHELRLDFL